MVTDGPERLEGIIIVTTELLEARQTLPNGLEARVESLEADYQRLHDIQDYLLSEMENNRLLVGGLKRVLGK